MKNISKESVEIFTWQRHGNRDDLGKEIEYVKNKVGNILNESLLGEPGFLKGKNILDAGCGGGNKTIARAIESGAKLVVGLDGSKSALAAANTLAEAMDVKNVQFVEGYMEDAESILKSIGIDKVDFIFNSFNLHHVTDYVRLLSTFSTVLAPGGFLMTMYVPPDTGWASFLIKNKIAYHLGRTPEGRLKVGKALFGWYDRNINIKKMHIDWDSFYADRYSAYYAFLPTGRVVKTLREVGFEILETEPELRTYEYLYRKNRSKHTQWIIPIVRKIPFGETLLLPLIRINQFIRGGETRGMVCIKTVRKNLHLMPK